jgi:hypothetical protein
MLLSTIVCYTSLSVFLYSIFLIGLSIEKIFKQIFKNYYKITKAYVKWVVKQYTKLYVKSYRTAKT